MTIISLKRQSQAINGHYCMNYSINDINLSSSDTNLSLSDVILSLDIKQSQRDKNALDIKEQFSDVTEDITHFIVKKRMKNNAAVEYASHYLLAFFVPDNSSASQAVTIQSSTTLRSQLSVSRGHSLIYIASETNGASRALHDVNILLHMIYQEKITLQQAIAMARLSHDATNAWAYLLYSSLESINQTLSSNHLVKWGV